MAEAIILAGGLGTRLSSVIQDVPKSMALVKGKPFLSYILDYLLSYKINKVVLAVGYKKEYIKEYFGTKYKDIFLEYSDEEQPLYTGGAAKRAMQKITDTDVFILNGDTFFDIDIFKMLDFFHFTNSDICIAIKELSDFSRYGEIKINSSGDIYSFEEKKHCQFGYINGGIYLTKNTIFDTYDDDIFSLENNFFPYQLNNKIIKGFISSGFFIDIGIPEDYFKSQNLMG